MLVILKIRLNVQELDRMYRYSYPVFLGLTEL